MALFRPSLERMNLPPFRDRFSSQRIAVDQLSIGLQMTGGQWPQRISRFTTAAPASPA
jgi:hypothetical protein